MSCGNNASDSEGDVYAYNVRDTAKTDGTVNQSTYPGNVLGENSLQDTIEKQDFTHAKVSVDHDVDSRSSTVPLTGNVLGENSLQDTIEKQDFTHAKDSVDHDVDSRSSTVPLTGNVLGENSLQDTIEKQDFTHAKDSVDHDVDSRSSTVPLTGNVLGENSLQDTIEKQDFTHAKDSVDHDVDSRSSTVPLTGNNFGENSLQDTIEKEDFTNAKDSADHDVDSKSSTVPLTGGICNIPNNSQVYEECVDLGRQIRSKIELWIERRKETAKQLIVIAEALEKVHNDVAKTRVTAGAVAFAGGFAAIVGTVLSVATAGLGAPVAVAVCGGLASVAGAATSGIAQAVEGVISSNDMKKAEAALESDRQTGEEIQELREKLTLTLEQLDMEGLSCEQKLTYFIFHQEFYGSGLRSPKFNLYHMRIPEAVFQVVSAVLNVGGKTASAIGTGVLVANLVRSAHIAGAGARTAGAVAVKVARIGIGVGLAAGGIGLVFDVAEIVSAANALATEGKTDTSEKLLATAKVLEKSAATMEGHLDQASNWFKETAPVVAHLDRLQVGDVTIDAELSPAESFIMKSLCGESNVNKLNGRLFVNNVKLFYDLVKFKLKCIQTKLDKSVSGSASQTNEAFVDSDSDNSADPSDCAQIDPSSVTDDSVDIVLIARASIPADDSWAWETGSALVDHPGINDVTFYQPWNCALDADVMHAVCRGELKASSRDFKHCIHSGPRGQSRLDCSQKSWNYMTRAKQTPIPRIDLDPVFLYNLGQCDINSSLCLFDKRDDNGTVRLVVPYAADVLDKRSYGLVPLSIVCQAIGAACHVLGLTATVHVLSDLTVGDGQSHVSEIKQYCHVTSDGTDGRPTMTCRLTDPAGVTEFRQTVRRFLQPRRAS